MKQPDAERTLATQTSLIEELDTTSFTTSIEIGAAMLVIKEECGDYLYQRAIETQTGKRGRPVSDRDALVAKHLKSSPHLKTRSRSFSPQRVGQMTAAASLVRFQRTAGTIILPTNEAMVRPLTRIKTTDEDRAAMWDEAVTVAGGGWPKPREVQAVADQHYPREKKPKKTLTLAQWLVEFDDLAVTLGEVKENRDAISAVAYCLERMNVEETQSRPHGTPEQYKKLNKIKSLARKNASKGERENAKAAEARIRATFIQPDLTRLVKKPAAIEESNGHIKEESNGHIKEDAREVMVAASDLKTLNGTPLPQVIDEGKVQLWLDERIATTKRFAVTAASVEVVASLIFRGNTVDPATAEQIATVRRVVEAFIADGIIAAKDEDDQSPVDGDGYIQTPKQVLAHQRRSIAATRNTVDPMTIPGYPEWKAEQETAKKTRAGAITTGGTT